MIDISHHVIFAGLFFTIPYKYHLHLSFQILLCFIWLRRYRTMHHLAMHFGISVGLVHRIIHKFIPYIHSWVVPKYIRWHNMAHWRSLAGFYPEWPHVVAILDCTPFRINKPKGKYYIHNHTNSESTWLLNNVPYIENTGEFYSRVCNCRSIWEALLQRWSSLSFLQLVCHNRCQRFFCPKQTWFFRPPKWCDLSGVS